MRFERACRSIALAIALVAALGSACARPAARPLPSATVAGTANPVVTVTGTSATPATPSVTSTGTPIATAIAGATIKVGDWTVTVAHFRALVTEPDGVNVRSSPEVKPDNRTGSLPTGAAVDVEGTTTQGQEAMPGQGTNWYYLGTVGASPPTPQFIYGPAGTLAPVSASATPAPAGSATPAPAGSATPVATPTAAVTATP
jgi:hypothetical protein